MLINERTASITEKPLDAQDASVQGPYIGGGVSGEEKGKGKSTIPDISEIMAVSKTSSDMSMVDWKKYDPPEGLKHTGNIESDMVIQIIQESIDRIKAQILEEEERNLAAETAKQRQEEEVSERIKDGNQPESGSSILEDLTQATTQEHDVSAAMGMGSFPTELPKRARKRTLMNLFRKFNSGPERGESSAAGAARHRLLTSSSSAAELTTHSARKRFVLDLIKKATGEDPKNSDPSTPELEVECVSCLDDFNPNDTVRAPCHSYCTPCFRRLIASACQNEERWPPKCCLNSIPRSTIIANVDEAQKAEYRERAREWNIPLADRIYCSRPECGLLIRPEYIIPVQNLARCTAGHYTCTFCRNPEHDGDICPQDKDLQRTNELAEEEGWKRCYGCHAYVEHGEACQHMTCRCGAEFCYVCGARWRTCACTMDQLATLKERVAARRRERTREEAAEEADMMEAIRLVAEFEREEALKAELLHQEQARLAEERREAELEERIHRESERRRAVMLKFETLRSTFAEVHEIQQNLVTQHHKKRERQFAQKTEETIKRVVGMHELERELQRAKVEARIAKREGKFRAEYVSRRAEEREIEEQYAAKLHAFWGSRKGGEEKTRAALQDLKMKMEEGFKEWKSCIDGELDTYRHHLREQLAIGEELMDEEERRLFQRAREAALTLARRNTAEMRWVREVIQERGRLLQGLESEEIENGDDIDTWFAEGPLDEALAANPWQ